MDLQKLIDTMNVTGSRERSNYHATFGGLIDKLKNADESARLDPKIAGISSYRGYYIDIALCTEDGQNAYKTEYNYDAPNHDWGKFQEENEIKIVFPDNPKKLAEELESLIDMWFDGYKGGYNKITRETPLWLATDYGDCSGIGVVEITDDLKLITKKVD